MTIARFRKKLWLALFLVMQRYMPMSRHVAYCTHNFSVPLFAAVRAGHWCRPYSQIARASDDRRVGRSTETFSQFGTCPTCTSHNKWPKRPGYNDSSLRWIRCVSVVGGNGWCVPHRRNVTSRSSCSSRQRSLCDSLRAQQHRARIFADTEASSIFSAEWSGRDWCVESRCWSATSCLTSLSSRFCLV